MCILQLRLGGWLRVSATGAIAVGTAAQLRRDTEELHAALTALVRIYQFRDRDGICCYDLSVTQYYALDTLIARGPLTVGDLAAALYLEKSTMSRVIDGVVRRGYIERRRHPDDARAVLLNATGAGRELHGRIRAGTIAQQERLLAEFDPEVRQATARLIAHLARAVAGQLGAECPACCCVIK